MGNSWCCFEALMKRSSQYDNDRDSIPSFKNRNISKKSDQDMISLYQSFATVILPRDSNIDEYYFTPNDDSMSSSDNPIHFNRLSQSMKITNSQKIIVNVKPAPEEIKESLHELNEFDGGGENDNRNGSNGGGGGGSSSSSSSDGGDKARGEGDGDEARDEGDRPKGKGGKAKGKVDKTKGEAGKTKGKVDKANEEVDRVKEEVDKANEEVDKAKEEIDKAKGEADETKEEDDNAKGEGDEANRHKREGDKVKDKMMDKPNGDMNKAKGEADKPLGNVNVGKDEANKTKDEITKAKSKTVKAKGEKGMEKITEKKEQDEETSDEKMPDRANTLISERNTRESIKLPEEEEDNPSSNSNNHVNGHIGDSNTESYHIKDDPIIQEMLIAESNKIIELILTLTCSAYDGYENIYTEKKQDHLLKIYLQSYMSAEKNRINKVRSEWYVECQPEQYISFMNNIPEQKKLDNSMSDFTEIDSFDQTQEQGYSVLYLAYKKMLIATPRDFVYMKHYRKLNETAWCDISTSIMHKRIPTYKNKIRGQIILSGQVVKYEPHPKHGKMCAKINLYSECDFKTNVPAFMAKSFTIDQTKKYIEKCISRIKELYIA